MNFQGLLLFAGLVSCAVGEKDDVMIDGDLVDEESFSKRWRSLYSKEALKVQPKWKPADQQPDDLAYEVRNYVSAYWASSHEPCWDQDKAASYGYVNLYFYFSGFNYQGFTYPLTFPIITSVQKVDTEDETEPLPVKGKRRGRGGKKTRRPKQCPIKHTSMLYLPVERESEIAVSPGDSLSVEKVPERVVYVKEYYSNYTSSYCNQKAIELAVDLVKDSVQFSAEDWYCARYSPGMGELDTRYEVWFVGTEE